jgi:hypothetical protein
MSSFPRKGLERQLFGGRRLPRVDINVGCCVIRPIATAIGCLVNGPVNAPLKAVRTVLQTRHSISFFGLPCAAQGRRLGWVLSEPVSLARSCLTAGVTIPGELGHAEYGKSVAQ